MSASRSVRANRSASWDGTGAARVRSSKSSRGSICPTDAGWLRARCEARYRELHRSGRTTVLVSHNPKIITEFCDRALLLEHGRIVCAGPAADVAREYTKMLTPPEPAA